LFHLLDLGQVTGNLLLHQALVFLQFGKPLLKLGVFLPLKGNSLVVGVTHELESRDKVGHVVRVLRFKLMPHCFDLRTVSLNFTLVGLNFLVRLYQEGAQMVYIVLDTVSIGSTFTLARGGDLGVFISVLENVSLSYRISYNLTEGSLSCRHFYLQLE
jgi:hypothetical protein